MFVEGGYDKKMKGLETERQVFLDRKTKKQIYNTYFERQKDKKNKFYLIKKGRVKASEKTNHILAYTLL